MNQSRRLRPEDAAEYVFGPTKSGVQRLAKLRLFGGGPVFLKLGKSVFYDSADLDAWLDANRRQSTADNRTRDAA